MSSQEGICSTLNIVTVCPGYFLSHALLFCLSACFKKAYQNFYIKHLLTSFETVCRLIQQSHKNITFITFKSCLIHLNCQQKIYIRRDLYQPNARFSFSLSLFHFLPLSLICFSLSALLAQMTSIYCAQLLYIPSDSLLIKLKGYVGW